MILFKATHINVTVTKSLLIPGLCRGLPTTAGAAKPVTSRPTTARIQRAAVQRQSRCRSSRMMMASIWVSLGQALMFSPPYFLSQPWDISQPLVPRAHSPRANTDNLWPFCSPCTLLLSLPCPTHAKRAPQLLAQTRWKSTLTFPSADRK